MSDEQEDTQSAHFAQYLKSRVIHPWAREGSKASKSIGPDRWFADNGFILPTAKETEDFCQSVIDGKSDVFTKDEVLAYLASKEWVWVKNAHRVKPDKDRTAASLEDSGWKDKLYPADLVSYHRDAPLLSAFLFDGEVFSILVGGVIRVAISFYERMISDDPKALEVDELMVREPTKTLVSLLSTADPDSQIEEFLWALSNKGVPFSTYAEAMKKYQGVANIANDVIVYCGAESIYDEDTDSHVAPDSVMTIDGLALFIMESYLSSNRIYVVYDEDINIDMIIDFARAGVYESKVIKNCVAQGIDPMLASRI